MMMIMARPFSAIPANATHRTAVAEGEEDREIHRADGSGGGDDGDGGAAAADFPSSAVVPAILEDDCGATWRTRRRNKERRRRSKVDNPRPRSSAANAATAALFLLVFVAVVVLASAEDAVHRSVGRLPSGAGDLQSDDAKRWTAHGPPPPFGRRTAKGGGGGGRESDTHLPTEGRASSAQGCSEKVLYGSGDCRKTPHCCSQSGLVCYEKNVWWASCRKWCMKGERDSWDDWPWSCEVIGGSGGSPPPEEPSEQPPENPAAANEQQKPAEQSSESEPEPETEAKESGPVIAVEWGGSSPWTQQGGAANTQKGGSAAAAAKTTTSTTTSSASTPAAQSQSQQPVTYSPGDLTVRKHGLFLSTGLDVRIIANSGRRVSLTKKNGKNDGFSSEPFHFRPDAGATFAVPEDHPKNPGGWIYLSNSEVWESRQGGVGAITFNKDGEVLDYRMILKGTTGNCGGGRTPWDTWISCEERMSWGHCYEVDPFLPSTHPSFARPKMTSLSGGTMGTATGGAFESFAHDVRDKQRPRFFVTEDRKKGPLRRFTPTNPDWNSMDGMKNMLHGEGTLEYLLLYPGNSGGVNSGAANTGTFAWTTDKKAAKKNAKAHYQSSEGIDVIDDELYFVTKSSKELFILNLDAMTYRKSSTDVGKFDGDPDQLKRLIGPYDDPAHNEKGLLYFTEDLGINAGVHCRDSAGKYFTVFESPVYDEDETTGLSFSDEKDGPKHMYVSYQENGILFDIFRKDGRSFTGRMINIKYHSTGNNGGMRG